MEIRCLQLIQDDEAISKLVDEYGIKQWALIGRKLNEIYGIRGRTGKQCRERWHNHINPQVKKTWIGHEEEGLIFKALRKYGTKWAEIAKDVPGRTDNIVKNHFYSIIRKEIRRIKKYLKHDIPVYDNITIELIFEMLKKYKVPISVLRNEYVINEIIFIGGDEISSNILFQLNI